MAFARIDVLRVRKTYNCVNKQQKHSFLSTVLCTFDYSLRATGVLNKFFIRGGSSPRSNPLPFLTAFFHEKGTPFVYLLLTTGTLFTYLVQNFASQLCSVFLTLIVFFFPFAVHSLFCMISVVQSVFFLPFLLFPQLVPVTKKVLFTLFASFYLSNHRFSLFAFFAFVHFFILLFFRNWCSLLIVLLFPYNKLLFALILFNLFSFAACFAPFFSIFAFCFFRSFFAFCFSFRFVCFLPSLLLRFFCLFVALPISFFDSRFSRPFSSCACPES